MIQQLKLTWHCPDHDIDRVFFTLEEPLDIAGEVVHPPFKTDGATIPPPIRGWFQPLGRYFPAAILHDWALQNCPDVANKLFLQAMKEQKVSLAVRYSFYALTATYQFIKRKGK